MSSEPEILTIGLSGPSSSGKTTLARLLRGIFNTDKSPQKSGISVSLFILHEDDFYKNDAEIPTRQVTSLEHGTRTLQDWDCVESLNLPLLEKTLQHIAQHGTLPPDTVSKEDQNSVGKTPVSDDEIKRHERETTEWLESLSREGNSVVSTSGTDVRKEIRICVLDGFLLFPAPPSSVTCSSSYSSSTITTTTTINTTPSQSLLEKLHTILTPVLDRKLFVPCTYEQTVQRRAARSGYVTMEGFWTDPPGYVEDVVWPNYARDHTWLFVDESSSATKTTTKNNIDKGKVNRAVAEQNGIAVGPGSGDAGLDEMLEWGVQVLKDSITKKLVGSSFTDE